MNKLMSCMFHLGTFICGYNFATVDSNQGVLWLLLALVSGFMSTSYTKGD